MTIARKMFGLGLVAAALTGGAAMAEPVPPVPATPAPVADVVVARAFTVDRPFTHYWRAEKAQVRTGYVLVLRVDPDLVHPRQEAEPVLYVGKQTAERVNHGHESGHVVALVPGVIDPKHPEYLDLRRARIWFGAPRLPEHVDAATVEQERQLAAGAGLRPLPVARTRAAVARGGDELHVASKRELLREVATLIERYSPQEQALVTNLRPAETPVDR
jgi:hypothetical protein